MAAIVPVPLIGTPFKITFIFGGGKMGWTESYYVVVTGGTPASIPDTFPIIIDLVAERRKILSTAYSIEAVRVEMVAGALTGQSKVFGAPALGMGGGLDANDAAGTWLTWWLDEEDLTGTIKGSRSIRGASTDLLEGFTPDALLPTTGIPTLLNAYIKKTSIILGNGFRTGSLNNVRPAIRSYDKAAYLASRTPLTQVSLTGNNQLTFTTATAIPGVQPNQVFKVTVKRNRCLKGVSGRAQLVGAVPTVAPFTYITDKQFCCSVVDLVKAIGNIGIVTYSYYAYASYNPNSGIVPTAITARKIAIKKTGRAFFVTVGRRGSRCC